MEIKDDWSIAHNLDTNQIYVRLGFRTKKTSGSEWVNGNVPWFRRTAEIAIGEDVWGDEPGSMGDGWILPPNLSTLDGTYNYVSGTAVNSFIPINYVGDAQIVSWHFFFRTNICRTRMVNKNLPSCYLG